MLPLLSVLNVILTLRTSTSPESTISQCRLKLYWRSCQYNDSRCHVPASHPSRTKSPDMCRIVTAYYRFLGQFPRG
eukprot:5208354-Pleurochrysis_carterae.AAC.1